MDLKQKILDSYHSGNIDAPTAFSYIYIYSRPIFLKNFKKLPNDIKLKLQKKLRKVYRIVASNNNFNDEKLSALNLFINALWCLSNANVDMSKFLEAHFFEHFMSLIAKNPKSVPFWPHNGKCVEDCVVEKVFGEK